MNFKIFHTHFECKGKALALLEIVVTVLSDFGRKKKIDTAKSRNSITKLSNFFEAKKIN